MSLLVKHFIGQPKLLLEVKDLGLEASEREELEGLITLLYHQKLLNRLLEYLEESDKRIFLELVVADTDQVYLEFLHQKIDNLENLVASAIVEIEEQIVEDIESLGKNNVKHS